MEEIDFPWYIYSDGTLLIVTKNSFCQIFPSKTTFYNSLIIAKGHNIFAN